MSTNTIIDAYASLRRELSLIFAAQLKSSEFGPKQMTILYKLIQSPLSMKELAAFCQSDPAATSRTVASLEKAGLIRRRGDEKDSRRSIIELTAKGKLKAASAGDIRKIINEKVNATLTGKEQKLFRELLVKVASGLQAGSAEKD